MDMPIIICDEIFPIEQFSELQNVNIQENLEDPTVINHIEQGKKKWKIVLYLNT